MKSISYIWRMALRRKAACLLVVISTMIATVFMLFYPGLIENTRARLAETYNGITVTGSLLTEVFSNTPAVSGSTWENMQESGYFSQMYGSSGFSIDTFPKEILEEAAGSGASEQAKLNAFQTLLMTNTEDDVGGSMIAYSTFETAGELVRIRDDIRWLEGYDETCLEGAERICIVPESWGYEPGDTVPLLSTVSVGASGEIEGIFRMKVAGTYPGKITALTAAMPLKTMEELSAVATAAQKQHGIFYEWIFSLDEVYFTVSDNQKLDEIKTMMTEWGLRDNKAVRVRIDDRTLKETVDPIESNLAQLEGSYLFFFVMIAAIGYFISFLLARGRKGEYAIMRMLGESRLQVTMKALLEQFVLCLGGVILGAAIGWSNFHWAICGVILLCYTIGAAAAVMLTVRVNVMDILRDKE